MPQNPQNTIIKTAFKHYDQFRSVRTESLRCLKIATDTGKKHKASNEVKERYQQLLDFIRICIIKIEQ